MRFKDNKFRFSFEIPEGWNQEPVGFLTKWLSGVRVSIVPIERGANMNITCKSIEGVLAEVGSRDRALLQYLSSMGCEITRSGGISDELGGEMNTTILEYRNPANKPENIMRKISSVHNSVEYVLTFLGNPEKHDHAYKRVRDSFRFV
ncbi:MAG: hypothetical protein KKB21_00190 [Nanoarchaeota archaeon]|nr:hypothetical protein [Nanoarchaeota archaeon]MBU4085978.1 hypothetical protein [Nanoarchaeota archaeon]